MTEREVIPKVGMKVRVLSPDKKENWGIGEIIEVTELYLELDDGSKVLLTNTYPIIKLENGRIVEGLECWWYPLEWEEELRKVKKRENTGF